MGWDAADDETSILVLLKKSWNSMQEFNNCCYKYICLSSCCLNPYTQMHAGKHETGDKGGLDSLATSVISPIKPGQSTHVASARMTIKLELIPVKGLRLNRGQTMHEG